MTTTTMNAKSKVQIVALVACFLSSQCFASGGRRGGGGYAKGANTFTASGQYPINPPGLDRTTLKKMCIATVDDFTNNWEQSWRATESDLKHPGPFDCEVYQFADNAKEFYIRKLDSQTIRRVTRQKKSRRNNYGNRFFLPMENEYVYESFKLQLTVHCQNKKALCSTVNPRMKTQCLACSRSSMKLKDFRKGTSNYKSSTFKKQKGRITTDYLPENGTRRAKSGVSHFKKGDRVIIQGDKYHKLQYGGKRLKSYGRVGILGNPITKNGEKGWTVKHILVDNCHCTGCYSGTKFGKDEDGNTCPDCNGLGGTTTSGDFPTEWLLRTGKYLEK